MQKKTFRRKNKKIFFSIICATIGKKNNLRNLCKSLQKQIFKNFELIICDQNNDNFNKTIVKKFQTLKIKFLKTKTGLSRSRNQGIKVANGSHLIFLDDDITLKNNFLDKIYLQLIKLKCDMVCFKVNDQNNKPLLNYPKFDRYLNNHHEIFNYISSVSFVIKKTKKLFFNEKIGLGSKNKYQSGEETDLILRIFKKYKIKIYFCSSITVIHKNHPIKFLSKLKKNYSYACGWKYVVEQRKLGIKFKIINNFKVMLNILFHILTLNFKKACYSCSTLLGRLNVL